MLARGAGMVGDAAVAMHGDADCERHQFLGLGIQPPQPSWGSIMSAGRQYVERAWWITLFPGAFLFLLVLSVNVLGDWLRDALNPRLR